VGYRSNYSAALEQLARRPVTQMTYLKGRGLDGIVPLDDLREIAIFRLSRRLRVGFECLICAIAVIGIAPVIAIAEACCDFA
jgi:hypothetical protein